MKQEEKLEEAKRLYKDANADQRYVLESLFPELAEIEDVRIRKELLLFFTERAKYTEDSTFNGLSSKEIIAWLEKQGEQKSYGQREECLDCQFNYAGECKGSCSTKKDECEEILEDATIDGNEDGLIAATIKYKNEQKLAWSEEDKKMFVNIKACLRNANKDYSREIDWLKSLRPQNKWKPSDEQMEALESATENCAYSEYQDCLRKLIGQLKKLMEE